MAELEPEEGQAGGQGGDGEASSSKRRRGKRGPKVTIEVDDQDAGGGGGDPAAAPGVAGSTYVPAGDGGPAFQPIFADFADTAAVGALRVRRTFPKDPPLGGNIGEFPPDTTEEGIRQRAGGGTYDVTAVNSQGRPIATKTIRIAGRPRIPDDDQAGGGAPVPGALAGELRSFFEHWMRSQEATERRLEASREREAKAEAERRDAREREFREFALLMKQESSQTLGIVSKATGDATQMVVTAVTNLTGKLLEARAADAGGGGGFGFEEAIKLFQMMQGMNQGGGFPPWLMFAMMAMQQYAPPPGSAEWYIAQGKEPPEHVKRMGGGGNPMMQMLPMMMMMNGGGMGGGMGGMNPMMMGMNPMMMGGMNPMMMGGMNPMIPGPRAPGQAGGQAGGSSSSGQADAPGREPADDGPDEIEAFLDYIAATPDPVLPFVLSALAREGRVPERANQAVAALATGNVGPMTALLEEYDSADLLPRLIPALQTLQQAHQGQGGGG